MQYITGWEQEVGYSILEGESRREDTVILESGSRI